MTGSQGATPGTASKPAATGPHTAMRASLEPGGATRGAASSNNPAPARTGRRVSSAGLAFIKRFEGFLATAAPLPDGRWVIGHSHIMPGPEVAEIDHEGAEALLRDDLEAIEGVLEAVVFAPLSQSQFDALVSLAFNIGLAQFRSSAVLRALNAGRALDAAAAFDEWRYALVDGGVCEMEALTRRRAAERALFLQVEDGVVLAPTARLAPVRFVAEERPSAEQHPAPSENAARLLAQRFAPREALNRVRSILGEAVTLTRTAPAAWRAHRARLREQAAGSDVAPAGNDANNPAETPSLVERVRARHASLLAFALGVILMVGASFELSALVDQPGANAWWRAVLAGGLMIAVLSAYGLWRTLQTTPDEVFERLKTAWRAARGSRDPG